MSARLAKQRARTVDWSDVRQRLAAAQRRGESLDADQERAILDRRARVLARALAAPETSAETLELVTFALTGERYALGSSCVMEVVKLQELVRLPGAPEQLLGLTNLRGEILPVFDLRVLLELPRAQLTDPSRLLVLGNDEPELGILADTVLEIERRRPGELLAPAEPLLRANMSYVRGVTRDALIVLDGEALLSDRRLFIDDAESALRAQRESQ